MYGFENAGPRPLTTFAATAIELSAAARPIVCELDLELFGRTADFLELASEARQRAISIRPVSRAVSPSAKSNWCDDADVQIVVRTAWRRGGAPISPNCIPCDGWPREPRAQNRQAFAVSYGRVKLAEHIAQCTGALTILLIGERPGETLWLASLSAYLAFQLGDESAAIAPPGSAAIRQSASSTR